MRWFFIWICLLPMSIFAQPNLVEIDTIKGCNCLDIDISNVFIAEEIVDTGQVSDTLAACYFHCIGNQYYKSRNYLAAIKNHENALTLHIKN